MYMASHSLGLNVAYVYIYMASQSFVSKHGFTLTLKYSFTLNLYKKKNPSAHSKLHSVSVVLDANCFIEFASLIDSGLDFDRYGLVPFCALAG